MGVIAWGRGLLELARATSVSLTHFNRQRNDSHSRISTDEPHFEFLTYHLRKRIRWPDVAPHVPTFETFASGVALWGSGASSIFSGTNLESESDYGPP